MHPIRMHLIPAAWRASNYLMSVGGMSRVDVVNRALQIARFVIEAERDGKELLLRDPTDGSVERVRITDGVAPAEPDNSEETRP